MLKKIFLSATFSLISLTALAQAPVPKADRNGDYSGRVGYSRWIVVDPDRNGINCRWSDTMPQQWYTPDAKWPTRNFSQWPIVRRFQKGTQLTANLTPAGFTTVPDASNKPWLKVSIGPQDQICLVRANQRYVKPVT